MATYSYLQNAPLATLADSALNITATPTARLAAWEAIHARIGETCGAAWAAIDSDSRERIQAALALDLSAMTFRLARANRDCAANPVSRLARDAREADEPWVWN